MSEPTTNHEFQVDRVWQRSITRDRAFELLNGSPVAGTNVFDGGVSIPQYLNMVEQIADYLEDGTIPEDD